MPPRRFGREERIEGVRDYVRGHARASVVDEQPHVFTGGHLPWRHTLGRAAQVGKDTISGLLSEVSAQSLPRQTACLSQNFLQVVGPEGQFPKPRQRGLLSQQLRVTTLLRVAQYTLSEWCCFGTFAS